MTTGGGRRAEIGLERRNRTRHRLAVAAARVIADLGQDNATIDDFIQAAEVARGTFYNYFPTREDLIETLWSHVGKDPFLQIQAACSDIVDPAARLITESRLVIEKASRDHIWGWLIYSMSANPQTVNDDLRSFPTPDLLAGETTGRFKYNDIASARDLVVSVVRAAMRAELTGKPAPIYRNSICQMILLAIGVDKSEVAALASLGLPEVDPQQTQKHGILAGL